jgi:hypothetical protein
MSIESKQEQKERALASAGSLKTWRMRALKSLVLGMAHMPRAAKKWLMSKCSSSSSSAAVRGHQPGSPQAGSILSTATGYPENTVVKV